MSNVIQFKPKIVSSNKKVETKVKEETKQQSDNSCHFFPIQMLNKTKPDVKFIVASGKLLENDNDSEFDPPPLRYA